jgi:Protein of unknown function (DUF3500)
MRMAALMVAACVVAMGLGAVSAPSAHDDMAAAATAFLDSLSTSQRETAQLEIDDANRLDWHYIPRARRGLAIKDMTGEERAATRRLMRATLSERGYLQADEIMELETVLREMSEAAGSRADNRDPELYYVTVFGEPGRGAWGWRIEGHHLSVNISSAGGRVEGVTPYFVGADPAVVPHSHRRAGFSALGLKTELSWRLLRSLSDEQRKVAVITDRAPRDILLSPGVDKLEDASGLALADMTPEQRGIAIELVHAYVDDMNDDLAGEQLARLGVDGLDKMKFAWAGSTEPGGGHYWRLHAGSFVIEYDNTQRNANHIHTGWRDLEHDFGGDALREHLRRDHSE